MSQGLQVFTAAGALLFDSSIRAWIPIDEFVVAGGASGSKSYLSGYPDYFIGAIAMPEVQSSGGHHVSVVDHTLIWDSFTGFYLFPPTTTATRILVFAR